MKDWAMLAVNVDDTEFDFPVIVQPKLNGIRACWKDGKLFTRQGKVWKPEVLPHLYESLKDYKEILDGELYSHFLPLQEIAAISAVKRNHAHINHKQIHFCIFDLIDEKLSARERLAFLRTKFACPYYSAIVPSHEVDNQKQLNDFTNHYVLTHNYEGMVIRIPSATYIHGRTNALIKMKPWKHTKAEVVSLCSGKGKFSSSLGSIWCKLPNGKYVSVGGGEITEKQRQDIWNKTQKIQMLMIRYRELSKSGIPLQPQIHELRLS